jgi:hypothetical protein
MKFLTVKLLASATSVITWKPGEFTRPQGPLAGDPDKREHSRVIQEVHRGDLHAAVLDLVDIVIAIQGTAAESIRPLVSVFLPCSCLRSDRPLG